MKAALIPLLAAIPALLAGCAGPPQSASLARAQQAIETASERGADRYAPLEIDIARERYRAARDAEDPQWAPLLADQALISAKTAMAKTDQALARESLADLARAAGDPLLAETADPVIAPSSPNRVLP